MELLLCMSQQENKHPYRFAGTGIQVYTFEEALYHVYHHWKQSVDDVCAPAMMSWASDTLGLAFIASAMKDISRIEQFSKRMLAFLKIIKYFDDHDLAAISPELERWEKRLEWETYKERADDLVSRGEPNKAITLYRRALQFDENIRILNNLSVAYMQIEAYEDACRFLKRAIELDDRPDNWQLHLHYAEALISANYLDEAANTINYAEANAPEKAKADILFLRGDLLLKSGKSSEAALLFEQAIAIEPEELFVFRLADVFAGKRQYEKALEVLKQYIPNAESSLTCLTKMAELHIFADNLPHAISAIKKAINIRPGFAELWVRLARYHRLNYDLEKADEAIQHALSLDAGNERAKLESARIQKNMGRTKDYQQILKGMLAELKGRYREVN